ncbi:hypothetical protein FHT78_001349 [Rhizobium sp. BK196]|uniref:hypothetical protein n=1 Tax=Rhizobium sp. BK196 TaxID=2587073 RepID=UPI00161C9352|nr:hypothetical protein [Rhizobium sp. BK196]MBB3309620.1 hypothetical protein [Rhizobium sp. BK196]
MRQFIQKVVIGKAPGHQPATLEVHGRIASILAAMEAATLMEKLLDAYAEERKRCFQATSLSSFLAA